MSNRCLNAVFAHSASRGVARLVLIAVADRANDQGMAFCGMDDLRDRTRASVSQIHVALNHLRAAGELIVEARKGPMGCNIYRLTERLFCAKRDQSTIENNPQFDACAGNAPSGSRRVDSGNQTQNSGNRSENSGNRSQTLRPPDPNPYEPIRTPIEPANLFPDSLREQAGFAEQWGEFEQMRRALRKPLTDGARRLILNTLAERPQEAGAALSLSIRRSWQDVRWEWYDKERSASSSLRSSSAQGGAVSEMSHAAPVLAANSRIDRSRLDAAAVAAYFQQSIPYLVVPGDPAATLHRAPERALAHYLDTRRTAAVSPEADMCSQLQTSELTDSKL